MPVRVGASGSVSIGVGGGGAADVLIMLDDVVSADRTGPAATTEDVSTDVEWAFDVTAGVIGDQSVVGIPVLLEAAGGAGAHEFNTTSGKVSPASDPGIYKWDVFDDDGNQLLGSGGDPIWCVVTATVRTTGGTYTLRFFELEYGSGSDVAVSVAAVTITIEYAQAFLLPSLPFTAFRRRSAKLSKHASALAPNQIDNATLADMAQTTLKGRALGSGTGDPQDLTSTQARAVLNVQNGATDNQTGAEIKTAYEVEANAYTDTKDTKLDGIADGADAAGTLVFLDDVVTPDRAAPGPTEDISADAEWSFDSVAGVIGDGSVVGIPVLLEVIGGTGAHEFDTTSGKVAPASDPRTYRLDLFDSDGFQKLFVSTPTWCVITTTARTTGGTYTLRCFRNEYGSGAEVVTSISGTIIIEYAQGFLLSAVPYGAFRRRSAKLVKYAAILGIDQVTNANLSNMAAAQIKGRSVSGAGDPQDLTPIQVRAVISLGLIADDAANAGTPWTQTYVINSGSNGFQDFVIDDKIEIIDWVAVLAGAGTAGSLLICKTPAGAKVTDDVDMSGGSEGDIFRPLNLLRANSVFAAAASIRWRHESTGGDFPGAFVTLTGVRRA